MRDMKAIPLAVVATLCAALLGCAVGEGLSRLTARPEPEVREPSTKAVAAIHEMKSALDEMTVAETAAPASEPALDPEAVARGKKVYVTSCVTCHAADGTGVSPIGSNLTTSEMVKTKDLKAIADLIRNGRAKDDKANKSGYPMPAKGTNPLIKDKQVNDVAAYVASMGAK